MGTLTDALKKALGEQTTRVRAHTRRDPESGKVSQVKAHTATRKKADPASKTAVRNSAGLSPRVFDRVNKLLEAGQAEITKVGTKWQLRVRPEGKVRYRTVNKYATQAEALNAVVAEFGIKATGTSERTYKDVGKKIGGARKDTATAKTNFAANPSPEALSAIEKEDPDVARRQCQRNVIWPEPSPEYFDGKSPCFEIGVRMVYSCIPAKLPKEQQLDPSARMNYLMAVQFVERLVMGATTTDELHQRLAGVRTEVNAALKEGQEAWWQKRAPQLTEYQYQIVQHTSFLPDFLKWVVEHGSKRGYQWYDWDASVRAETGKAKEFRFDPASGVRIETPQDELIQASRESAQATLDRLFGKRERSTSSKPAADDLKWERSVPSEYDRKGGQKISIRRPEEYISRFGLRGVEFGNWMDHEASREHVDRCAEALQDLSDMLGIKSEQISVNGRLALAFGARGVGKFAAHYEFGKVVINIAKKGGTGMLSHEWAHFLDHAIGMVEVGGHSMASEAEGKLGSEDSPVLSAFGEVMSIINSGTGTQFLRPMKDPKHTVWPEIDLYLKVANNDAQKAIDSLQTRYRINQAVVDYVCAKTGAEGVNARTGHSQYSADSEHHQKSKTGYWTRPWELFARAFECYVEDTLKAKRRSNNYLVSGGFEASNAPYPKGEERRMIGEAFGKLFEAIRTTEMLKKALGIIEDRFERVTTPDGSSILLAEVQPVQKAVQNVRVRTRTRQTKTGPVVQPAHTERRKKAEPKTEPAAHEQVYEIPLSQIQPDPNQHRKTFPADTMRELADSIQETGGNRTPIVVRRIEGPVPFQIIAGERRYRALNQNRMDVARAVIRENVSDEDALLEQVIENLNRLNVSPTEEATAYRQLADGEIARAKRRKEWRRVDLSDPAAQDKLEALGRRYAAAKSGKQKSRVDYYIILTELPDEVRDMVDKGNLTVAHAHAVLRLTDPKEDSRNYDRKFRKERELHLTRMARHARANSGVTAKILNGLATEYIRANQQQSMFSDEEATGGKKQVRRQQQKANLAKVIDAVAVAINEAWDEDAQEFGTDALTGGDLQVLMQQIGGAMDSFGQIKAVVERQMFAQEAIQATKRRVVREAPSSGGSGAGSAYGGQSLFKAITNLFFRGKAHAG